MWIHYICCTIPLYVLYILTTSSRRYSCELCVQRKHEPEHNTNNQVLTPAEGNKQLSQVSAVTPQVGQLENRSTENTDAANHENKTTGENWSHEERTHANGVEKTAQATKICMFYKKNRCKYGMVGRGCSLAHPKPCLDEV